MEKYLASLGGYSGHRMHVLRTSPESRRYDQLTTFAIGRNHASWFLVFSKPYGLSLKRLDLCLNIVTEDSSTAGAVCPNTGRPVFTVGGAMGQEVLDMLDALRDRQGRCPVKVIRRLEEGREDRALAQVRVELQPAECAYACSRCGRWELEHGPRWKRCSGCQARCYCSVECQKDDWKPQYHKGECKLLREGKAHEAEMRRKLHDNNWFHVSPLSRDNSISNPRTSSLFAKAKSLGNWDLIAYGTHWPPRDVPGSAIRSMMGLGDFAPMNGEEETQMHMVEMFLKNEEVKAYEEMKRRLERYPPYTIPPVCRSAGTGPHHDRESSNGGEAPQEGSVLEGDESGGEELDQVPSTAPGTCAIQ